MTHREKLTKIRKRKLGEERSGDQLQVIKEQINKDIMFKHLNAEKNINVLILQESQLGTNVGNVQR